ncbi:MBL fold metallo-hydrolase [Patescibacteria group bacterium]|nr:MBL fold metallo-hydrolase [Patescibacteria group bacterium]MBU1889996.1 MBL fold metallo-hydrolase [Patescibacteria group bacterium]
MTEIKILVEGYAKELKKGWVASSTSCLITTEDKTIITDPGCNRDKLMDALGNEGLRTGDIDYVFLSHKHPDHVLLAGIFEKAKYITFDSNLVYDKDRMFEFDKHELGKNIEIIDTPGHVLEHLSLLVKTSKGRIAVAGDVIWWRDGEKQTFNIDQKDYAQSKGMNMKDLVTSRKKLVALADYIIPGHGKMFKAEK